MRIFEQKFLLMRRTLSFLVIFASIIILIGCSPVSMDQTRDEENFIDGSLEIEEDWRFSTATAPPIPDLRGTTLDVYLIGAISEPFREITTSISIGLKDGFDYLNSLGGVSGAQINYQFMGVKTYEEDLIEIYQDLVEEKNPFLILLATPVFQEFYDVINDSEIPVFYYGVGGKSLEKPEEDDYLFWLTPHPDQQMAFVLSEFWNSWYDIRPQGTFNEVKIGYVTWEGEFNYLSLTDEARLFIDQNNFSLDLEVEIPISANSSLTNFLLDSVAEGVTVIYTDTFSFGPAVLLNDLHSLGVSEFFVISGTQWLMGENIYNFVRDPSQGDQVYFPLSIAWWTEDDNSAIVKAIEIQKFSGRKEEEQSVGYLLSLGVVDITDYMLRLIFEEQQNGELDSQIIMDRLSGMKDYSVMDGLFEIDYSKNNRAVTKARLWSFSYEDGMTPVGSVTAVPELSYNEE